MANKPKRGVAKLGAHAQSIVHKMLDQGAKPHDIARAVAEQAHQKIHRLSIANYSKSYTKLRQGNQTARKETEKVFKKAKKQGYSISAMLRATVLERFAKAQEAKDKKSELRKMSLLQLEGAERKRRELELRRKQVSLAERRVKVFEERWKLDRQKAQATIDKLDRKARRGESLSAADVRQIREIYGLYEASERDWNSEERELRNLELETQAEAEVEASDDQREETASRKPAASKK